MASFFAGEGAAAGFEEHGGEGEEEDGSRANHRPVYYRILVDHPRHCDILGEYLIRVLACLTNLRVAIDRPLNSGSDVCLILHVFLLLFNVSSLAHVRTVSSKQVDQAGLIIKVIF